MTQAQVAGALGVTHARVSKIEHGEILRYRRRPRLRHRSRGNVDMVATLGDRSWKGA
jgi:transcriptional regulator with XRE-family HTH domain